MTTEFVLGSEKVFHICALGNSRSILLSTSHTSTELRKNQKCSGLFLSSEKIDATISGKKKKKKKIITDFGTNLKPSSTRFLYTNQIQVEICCISNCATNSKDRAFFLRFLPEISAYLFDRLRGTLASAIAEMLFLRDRRSRISKKSNKR